MQGPDFGVWTIKVPCLSLVGRRFVMTELRDIIKHLGDQVLHGSFLDL